MKNNPELILEVLNKVLCLHGEKSVSLHEPNFQDSKALSYLKECLDSNWVSSSGKWVKKFEESIISFTGAQYAIAVSNGTDALRLALHLIGVCRDEEVIVPSLSFVGTCNAISHLGGIPHFVDIEKTSLGMDPISLREHLEKIAIKKEGMIINKNTGRRISAICPVHVFGNPSNCFAIKKIADTWSLPMVEDAAEALGSFISNTHCGLIGDIGIISFNGNKLITTGGGGIIITKDKQLAERARHLSTTAKIDHPWEFIHDEIAWNDRMPNINAALGVAELENINKKLSLKKKLFNRYRDYFLNIPGINILENNLSDSISNNWLITLKIEFFDLKETIEFKNKLLDIAHKKGILLRPVWKPSHTLSIYKNNPQGDLKVTNDIYNRLINLPSSPHLFR